MNSPNGVQFGVSIASAYSYFLCISLVCFTLYLILPKGFRRHVFHSYPRRYIKSSPNREILVLGLQSEVSPRNNSSFFSNDPSVRSNRRQETCVNDTRRAFTVPGSSGANFTSPVSESGTWGVHDISFGISQRQYELDGLGAFHPFRLNTDEEEIVDFTSESKAPSLIDIESLASFSSSNPPFLTNDHSSYHPSAHHPDRLCRHKVPSEMVISSTLTSLREPGVRLYAHGTQCVPRRIWIQINVQREIIEWRTEDSHKNSNGARLGPKHVIPLQDILFVDVGKSTTALKQLPENEFSSDICFSILTRNGSLDLRTSNKLERDALVSCFCLILDTVYLTNPNGKHWRSLYDGVENTNSPSSTPTEKSFAYDTRSESDAFSGVLDTSLLSI